VELAQRGIGVSVLCPIPAARIEELRARIAAGIDPLYVGELVREAIEGDWAYIFTDTEFEPFVDTRFANIKAGFDPHPGSHAGALIRSLHRRRHAAGL
jgi:hypothetical protein